MSFLPLLGFLASSFFLGSIVFFVYAIRTAPTAVQSEDGFHVLDESAQAPANSQDVMHHGTPAMAMR